MHTVMSSLRCRGLILVACLGVGALVCVSASQVFGDDDPTDAKQQDVVKKKRHRTVRKTSQKSAEIAKGVTPKDSTAGEAKEAPKTPTQAEAATSAAAASPTAANSLPGATPASATKSPPTVKSYDFAAQLDKAGVSACRNQVNALASSTMGSVEKFNTVSNWSRTGGDKRAVSVAIGQKFAQGSVVPFSMSQVISAPNQQGSCDGFTVQVFPSPLSCGKLRESIVAQRGQQIGDLAGIPLMQDAAGRTMLVPTGSDTCVLVATRAFYSK